MMKDDLIKCTKCNLSHYAADPHPCPAPVSPEVTRLRDKIDLLNQRIDKMYKICLINGLCGFCGGDVYVVKSSSLWEADCRMCGDCDSTYSVGP